MFDFSGFNIEIKEIKEYYEELLTEIGCTEGDMYELKKEIEDGREEIAKLTSKLKLLKNTLERNRKNYSELENGLIPKKKQLEEYKEILESEEKRIESEKIDAFQNYVLNMEPKNAISCQLRNNTSTVNLLDEYCASEKEFLILKNQFLLLNNRGYVSLIITPHYWEIEVEGTQPTMTELKQNAGKLVYGISCSRLQPLLEEIQNIDNGNRDIPRGSKFAFNCPFLIGGQTSDNRMGYGCEWIGGGDYIEGTLYGEVTDFMVVGIIYEGSSWYY